MSRSLEARFALTARGTTAVAVSIAERVAFGLIAYVLLKTVAGRTRAVHPLLYVFAALFLARYALLS